MAVPGPSSRFLYYFDPTAALGFNLSGTPGRVGAFDPPAINAEYQELDGSFATYPTKQAVGYESSDDLTINLWADSALQELLDDLHGVTPADRRDERLIYYGWMSGDVVGKYFEACRFYQMKATPKTPQAKLTEFGVSFKPTGSIEIGIILHALGARTADGNSQAASIDNAAATTAGGTGFFGYTTYTADGATGLAVRVIDSADNASFAALITFTTITATTGGGQRSALSSTATVRRYVASDWDFTGTPGAGTTATFFVGFKRGA